MVRGTAIDDPVYEGADGILLGLINMSSADRAVSPRCRPRAL